MFNREVFFDCIRADPFKGQLAQSQVDGLNFLLDGWEAEYAQEDLRWMAYALATTFHETAQEMQPISEYRGDEQPYGQEDPVTEQCYWGRGYVQLTHKTNYVRADEELGLEGERSCEWHADNALDPEIATQVLYRGMIEGWFRSPHNLPKYFNDTVNDPYEAREIINGDKTIVPDWSDGDSIGNLIKGYHLAFLDALQASSKIEPDLEQSVLSITITIKAKGPITVQVEDERYAL